MGFSAASHATRIVAHTAVDSLSLPRAWGEGCGMAYMSSGRGGLGRLDFLVSAGGAEEVGEKRRGQRMVEEPCLSRARNLFEGESALACM